MPQRTNDFQQLVHRIELALARPGRTVTESRELVDSATGAPREVDVVIEAKEGAHVVTIGVECTRTARRATVEWIECMHGKHVSLPTNKLVLVSKAGFTSAALAKAKCLGHATYDLSAPTDMDWARLAGFAAVTVVNILQPVLTRVTAELPETPRDSAETWLADLPSCQLLQQGQETGPTVLEHVQQILRHPAVLRRITDDSALEGGVTMSLTHRFNPPRTLRLPDSSLKPILGLRIQARARREVSVVDMNRASYGVVPLVHGGTEAFGHQVGLVVVDQQDGLKMVLSVQ